MPRFTEHSNGQMRKRGISEDEVLQVLSRPEKTVLTRANRFASYAQVHGKHIVVIHEKINNEDTVITAMRVDRRRLTRLGFTQVR